MLYIPGYRAGFGLDAYCEAQFQAIAQAFARIGAFVPYDCTWSGGNPAKGNGTLSALVAGIGGIAVVKLHLVMGSTTTYGSGAWSFSLPSAHVAAIPFIGSVHIALGSARTLGVAKVAAGAAVMQIFAEGTDVAIGSASPGAWAENDTVSATLCYQSE